MNAEKRKNTVKTVAKTVICIIAVLLITVISYLLYVVLEYDRIEDGLALQVETPAEQRVQTGKSYSAITYNVGFGAYSPEFSFFLDTGTTADGIEVVGKSAKAASQKEVQKNTEGAISVIQTHSPDFVLLQEVDEKSNRSRFVNQREAFKSEGYGSVFAVNFHSAYLLYPFNDPIGKSLSGIMTLSRFKIDGAKRISLPLSTDFSKFFDLDRCITVNRLPVEGTDKQLVLINVHLSAYDTGGIIRKQQTELFFNLLNTEANNGNYVLAGGDFNQLLYDVHFPTTQPYNTWAFPFPTSELPAGFSVYSDADTPTCRNANMPYVKGESYTCIIDGFIASENVVVSQAKVVLEEFEYSDHNPVKITFSLN